MLRLTLKLLLVTLLSLVMGDVPTHTHDHRHTQKEREADGSRRKPMDHDHYIDGKHNTEFDHEVILGSKETAKEYHALSPEEAKQGLRILAEKMDADKDSFVERDELYTWILTSLRNLTINEARQQMTERDSNTDGYVTWYEHYDYAYIDLEVPGRVVSPSQLTENQIMYLEEDKILFHTADKNGDYKLSFEEYKRFSAPEDYPDMVEVLMRKEFDGRDVNMDNLIDFSEYLKFEEEDEESEERKRYKEGRKEDFDQYDKDKDGFIDEDEAIDWLFPSKQQTAIDEVDHLISESDVNYDKKLSYDEIVHNFEWFVGSEATMHGQSLRDEL